MSKVLIYGAYGYTGRLIIEESISHGIKPLLAGRNKQKLESVASTYDLEHEVIDISEREKLEEWLSKGTVVIHCAGPFVHTAKQMVEACLKTNTHYLDITGEYQVFDIVKSYSEQAAKKGLMLLPGAGFDVVPSDCLANHLKDKLPSATHLEIAFVSKKGGLSRGTTKTMIENLGYPQVYRKDGEYAYAKMGNHCKVIDYGDFTQLSMGISWGDISTAFFSTSILNIEVYSGTTQEQLGKVKKMGIIGFLLKTDFFRSFLLKKLDRDKDGPLKEKREKATMNLWGKVSNGDATIEAHLITPNGYTLTAKTAILITQKIMEGNYTAGYQSPATAYGKDLILEIEGCKYL
ncbi:MAG: trans-acting enoyl reductase family protein [Ekhidna sp.]